MKYLPKARLENIVIQETENELLIYDLISNKALCLNETSKIIWQACDGKTTFKEFREKVAPEFSDELIWLALGELQRKKLLADKVELGIAPDKLNRRKMIAKYGAMAISLPVISVIVAPTPANAQSVCICIGGSCATGTCMCPTGQTDCTGSCRDLNNDLNNCGRCGVMCAGLSSCVSGVCR